MTNFQAANATAIVANPGIRAAASSARNTPVRAEQLGLRRKLTAALLALVAFSTGCMPDSATGPGVDLYAHAPQGLRPFLGVYYDASITYLDVQTKDGRACEIEKLPFEPSDASWDFGVEHDMRSHLGVEYVNMQPRLATVDPAGGIPAVELGRLDVDPRTGQFTFSHSYVDHQLGATHRFQFDGEMVDPATPQRLHMEGRYTRISRSGNQSDVTFSIDGNRSGAFLGATYVPQVSSNLFGAR